MSTLSRIALALVLTTMLGCGTQPLSEPSVAPATMPAPAAPAPPAAPDAAGEPLAMPAMPAEPVGEPERLANGGAATDHWCCQYEGPLGKTHDLLDSPSECAERYADHSPEFITAPECAPVCCKYASDPADLSKGFTFAQVAAGNCDMRKGNIVESEGNASCRDPSKPVPRASPRPRPVAPPAAPAPKPPTVRERLRNPLNPKKK